ncbi:Elongation factor G (EF-G), partial [Durusdinium trenchii]
MMRYLEGETLTAQELEGAISKAIASGTLIPIFCTSIRRDIGIQELMAGLAAYSPAPTDVPRFALQDEDKVPLSAGPEEPLVAQVFKTRIDPFVAKMSYLRIFSGTLRKDESLMNSRTQKPIKISQIMSLQGSHHDNITAAGPGDIVAVVKIDDLRTGDTLTSGDGSLRMPCIPFPKPMIGLAVEPASQADQAKISLALHKIEEEDPTFYVEREEQTHEMVMHGMSELHLQVVQSRLHDREKVDIITHAPKIPYHETISGMSEGSYRHKKQSGGSGQFAEVHMKLSPCPHGIDPEEYFTKDRFESMRSFHYDPQLNFAFVDRISGGSIPNQFIPAVEKGVRERMSQGVVAGFQVQDVVVELFFGKDHPVDSNETAFKLAGSHCFRELFEQARPTLLEPIVSLDITIPDDKIGDITGDLNTRRGRMEGLEEVPGGLTQIHAKAPLAEVMTYARALSSMTAGQGSFGMEFSHYEPVPPNEQAKIIASAAKNRDRKSTDPLKFDDRRVIVRHEVSDRNSTLSRPCPLTARSCRVSPEEWLPTTAAELSRLLNENATNGRRPVAPFGGRTCLQFGGCLASNVTPISTTELQRVIDYPARDMTITVESGMRLDNLADILKAEGQRLALDIPQRHRATLGGAIATNASGPGRVGLGTWRDYVIGISAVDGQGRLFSAGGRVVKNVAGYDLCKLLVGSLGTLAVITQVTLKLRPLPAS